MYIILFILHQVELLNSTSISYEIVVVLLMLNLIKIYTCNLFKDMHIYNIAKRNNIYVACVVSVYQSH